MKFSNPRLVAEFPDWPIGGNNRGMCKFFVENGGKKGVRVVRQTQDKHGNWCKPKANVYGLAAAIVDGNDGKTYILQTSVYGLTVYTHDFKSGDSVRGDHSEAELREMIAAAK